MPAKRVRDPRRKSKHRLYVERGGVRYGTTTYPVDSGPKANDVQEERRK